MYKHDDARNRFLARTISVNEAYSAAANQARTNRQASEETKTRIEIQEFIKSECISGKSKEEIFNALCAKYGSKYEKYFDGWIEHHMQKFGKDKGEER